ncbi:MAG: aconitate hydratase AcnA [Chloroflexota bacterium]|nr:aconitate hydratase AcnA [Lentimicrobium sp.]
MEDLTGLKSRISTPAGEFNYFNLKELINRNVNVEELPFSIRILMENAIRNYNGITVTDEHLQSILNWSPIPKFVDIPFMPARVLMQDFTGVPAVVDIASLRSEVDRKKRNAALINPQVPADLVIDHSVQVDFYASSYAYDRNVELEYERNHERYSLLKWANQSMNDFSVLPPGMGICHQVNLEYLAKVVAYRDGYIFPDTLVGTDSHTPMINGIGVVGWGVGGIEAEAVMLGQPVYFMLPEVIGLKLTGRLREGTTATDLVLTVAAILRKKGVVGKLVEVFGNGLDYLTVPDRATISNMTPEFGSTITYFPPDSKTIEYLRNTGRTEEHISTVEMYLKANLMWRVDEDKIKYSDIVELNLEEVEPSLAGPKRPQDKISLSKLKNTFIDLLKSSYYRQYINVDIRDEARWLSEGGSVEDFHEEKHVTDKTVEEAGIEVGTKRDYEGLKSVKIKFDNTRMLLSDGSLVIASITSCTNTSNPSVMVGAGLLAKKAVERGLDVKPWVKTSMAPGSRVVTKYLEKSNLMPYLEALGFHIVGYGCTTCIGNSGPLPAHITKAVTENDLIVGSVLSGNRNFEARIHPLVKMNFLTSPLLVVAYAIAGRIDINLLEEPLTLDPNLEPVYLKDIWPTSEDISKVMNQVIKSSDYSENYANIFKGDDKWNELEAPQSDVYVWDPESSYVKEAPFFKDITAEPEPIKDIFGARVLLKLGDTVTTDHISPAGSIGEDSPAGQYLKSLGFERKSFNSYGSRRGNHEVMVRGTFANVRLKNQLVKREGGWTLYHETGEELTVYDAGMKYQANNIPTIILAGKEYGSGSSRDWAAKGTNLLGVKAVIAESYERIHRSNLVGMGILPLQFKENENSQSHNLEGNEVFDITGVESLKPNGELLLHVRKQTGETFSFPVIARLDSPTEIAYYKNGGILQLVLRRFLNS